MIDPEEYIVAHRLEDVRQLALRGVDPWILQQIEGWQTARHKLPTLAALDHWWYPVRLSMEQCSSETTARYKADLLARLIPEEERERMVDLTGGFGVDCYFCSRIFRRFDYVEQNEELCRIASHNLSDGIVHHCDSVSYLEQMESVSAILIDPARRDGQGRKVAGLTDCTPDLTRIHRMIMDRCEYALVKLSPMLDMREAIRQLPETVEVHIVSVKNECKEMLLVLGPRVRECVKVYCVNIPDDKPFVYDLSV